MDIVCCPGCSQPAEVVRRTHLCSTDGPIEHVFLLCLIGHVFLMPAAGLTSMCSRLPAEDAPRPDLRSDANSELRGGAGIT
jgi:hypothetical protein